MNTKELLEFLKENDFIEDRSWENPDEDGLMFYSLKKDNFRVEIKENWNTKYSTYENITLSILDCKSESYSNSGYIGYMGQRHLITLDNPNSKNLLIELFNHFKI
jgi:hypothetical protein